MSRLLRSFLALLSGVYVIRFQCVALVSKFRFRKSELEIHHKIQSFQFISPFPSIMSSLLKQSERVICLVDCDCFYASVEMVRFGMLIIPHC